MERTTTVEAYAEAIDALKVRYPNGMAMVIEKLGEPPMPTEYVSQEAIDATISMLENICEVAGLDR